MTRDPRLHQFFHRKEDAADYLAWRVDEIRSELGNADPEELAVRTGATFRGTGKGRGELSLPVWNSDVIVSFPQFAGRDARTGKVVDSFTSALVAYYFLTADGTPETGRCVAFTELPDGQFYTQAFQGYTGNKLARTFGNDLTAFGRAAASLGGRPELLADRAFSFRALPLVSLTVAAWWGDEDLPPSYRILFDAAVGHHLPTDACAIVGSVLTRRLIEAHAQLQEPGSQGQEEGRR